MFIGEFLDSILPRHSWVLMLTNLELDPRNLCTQFRLHYFINYSPTSSPRMLPHPSVKLTHNTIYLSLSCIFNLTPLDR